jgi:hypothetical protein
LHQSALKPFSSSQTKLNPRMQNADTILVDLTIIVIPMKKGQIYFLFYKICLKVKLKIYLNKKRTTKHKLDDAVWAPR